MPVTRENLIRARNAKNDEFYTQYSDIQREINAYLEFNPDVFRGKTILLPCDDPEWSNFTKFFAQNFDNFGIKKLISTSYATFRKKEKYDFVPYQLSLFETDAPQFDPELTESRGKIFTLSRDTNRSGKIDINDLEWQYLDGDGDFQSDEVKALRHEADIIITNPPFSLYIDFVKWLFEEDGKQFLIIGNKSSLAYKEVFPLIMNNKMWSGASSWSGGLWFITPQESDELANVASTWFTNIEHGRRHQPLSLMTLQDNLKFSKHKEIRGIGYAHYDNYDAIEVPFTDAIPSDYDGIMGVPVTFLEKYCPDQFCIVGLTSGREEYDAWPIKKYVNPKQINPNGSISNGSKVNTRAAVLLQEKPDKLYYTADNVDGYLQSFYMRILIKRKV